MDNSMWLVASFLVTLIVILTRIKKTKALKLGGEIACMKSIPLLGHLHYFFTPPREGADKMTTALHLLNSMAKLFKNEDMFSINIGPKKVVILTSAESAEVLLTQRDELDKSFFYNSFHRMLGNSLFTCKGDEFYLQRRKVMGDVFHKRNMPLLNDKLNYHVSALIGNLKLVQNEPKVDISQLVTRCIFNNAFDLCLDTNLDKDLGEKVLDVVERSIEIIGERIFKPWLHLDFLFLATKTGKEFREINNFLFELIKGICDENETYIGCDLDKKKSLCILDFIKAHPESSKLWISMEEVVRELFTVIFAAYDTSRNSLEWCLFKIGHDQRVQEKIQQELHDVIISKNEPLTWNNIANLKYLKCVIKEVLRLCPPGPVFGRKLKKDLVIQGKHLPKGSEVTLLVSSIHRNERYFENPEKFYPERFESDDIPMYAYLPFSSGLRNCFGTAFAYRQMMTILANIFINFNVTSLDREDSLFTKTTVLQRAHKPVMVHLHPRNYQQV